MEKRRWQLQEAKARLSQLVQSARTAGPQEISVRGELAVVVLSKSDYDRLQRTGLRFVEFVRESPLAESDLDIERDGSLTREIQL